MPGPIAGAAAAAVGAAAGRAVVAGVARAAAKKGAKGVGTRAAQGAARGAATQAAKESGNAKGSNGSPKGNEGEVTGSESGVEGLNGKTNGKAVESRIKSPGLKAGSGGGVPKGGSEVVSKIKSPGTRASSSASKPAETALAPDSSSSSDAPTTDKTPGPSDTASSSDAPASESNSGPAGTGFSPLSHGESVQLRSTAPPSPGPIRDSSTGIPKQNFDNHIANQMRVLSPIASGPTSQYPRKLKGALVDKGSVSNPDFKNIPPGAGQGTQPSAPVEAGDTSQTDVNDKVDEPAIASGQGTGNTQPSADNPVEGGAALPPKTSKGTGATTATSQAGTEENIAAGDASLTKSSGAKDKPEQAGEGSAPEAGDGGLNEAQKLMHKGAALGVLEKTTGVGNGTALERATSAASLISLSNHALRIEQAQHQMKSGGSIPEQGRNGSFQQARSRSRNEVPQNDLGESNNPKLPSGTQI